MTKNNTAAVEFHRCLRMRMQWIPGALFSPVSPAPAIHSTPWAPGAEARGDHDNDNKTKGKKTKEGKAI